MATRCAPARSSNLRFRPGRARSINALSGPSSQKRLRVLTTVHLLIDGASAILVVNPAFVGPDVRLCWSSYTSLARCDAVL